MSNDLREQRILAGVAEWDRASAREELEEARMEQVLQHVRKLAASLKSDLADLEHYLAKPTDGIWDPIQGIAHDVSDAGKELLKIAKSVNAHRDKRSKGAPWQ